MGTRLVRTMLQRYRLAPGKRTVAPEASPLQFPVKRHILFASSCGQDALENEQLSIHCFGTAEEAYHAEGENDTGAA
jgi:hypothetical protein